MKCFEHFMRLWSRARRIFTWHLRTTLGQQLFDFPIWPLPIPLSFSPLAWKQPLFTCSYMVWIFWPNFKDERKVFVSAVIPITYTKFSVFFYLFPLSLLVYIRVQHLWNDVSITTSSSSVRLRVEVFFFSKYGTHESYFFDILPMLSFRFNTCSAHHRQVTRVHFIRRHKAKRL